MKTTVKQLATGTFLVFLLLAGNVQATGTKVKASSQINIETTLQLEKWMTDEVLWNTNSVSISGINQETETSLEIENWMTSEEIWKVNNSFVEQKEESLELEKWMTSEKAWNPNFNVEKINSEVKNENSLIDNKVCNR